MATEEMMLSQEVVFIKHRNGIKICRKNPDYCSIFLAELIAIEETLKYYANESITTDNWILSYSRISIQRSATWWKLGDISTAHTVQHLNFLCANNNSNIYFQ